MRVDLMRDRATSFPVLEKKDQVRSMRVWHCKYKSLQPLAELPNLQELVIATYPDKTLRALGRMGRLSYLRILNMPDITSLEKLSGLTCLKTLSLETSPSWDASAKRTVVSSLEPIAAIAGLEHLQLFGVCPPDKSLAPLERLKSLRSARFQQYPQEEVERFFRVTGAIDQFNPASSFD